MVVMIFILLLGVAALTVIGTNKTIRAVEENALSEDVRELYFQVYEMNKRVKELEDASTRQDNNNSDS